jgi:hypothetical protein
MQFVVIFLLIVEVLILLAEIGEFIQGMTKKSSTEKPKCGSRRSRGHAEGAQSCFFSHSV